MLLFNKGKSSIMFTDGGETKFLAPMQQMVVKDEDEARKIIKFYSFVEEIIVEKEKPKEEKKVKKKYSRKKKLQAFEG